jgi:hypothetical protein
MRRGQPNRRRPYLQGVRLQIRDLPMLALNVTPHGRNPLAVSNTQLPITPISGDLLIVAVPIAFLHDFRMYRHRYRLSKGADARSQASHSCSSPDVLYAHVGPYEP